MANKTTPIVQDIVFKMKADLGNMGAAMKQIASQLRAGEYNLGEKDVKKLITTVNRASTQIFRMGQTLDSTEDFSEKAFKAIFKDFTAISKLFGELPIKIDAVGLSFEELAGAYDPKKLRKFGEELAKLKAEETKLTTQGYKASLLTTQPIVGQAFSDKKTIINALGNEKALKVAYNKELSLLEQHLAESKALVIKAKEAEAQKVTEIYDKNLDVIANLNFRTKEGKAAAQQLIGYNETTASQYTNKRSAEKAVKQLRKDALKNAGIDEKDSVTNALAVEQQAIARIKELKQALTALIAINTQYQASLNKNKEAIAANSIKTEAYKQEVVEAAETGVAKLEAAIKQLDQPLQSAGEEVNKFGEETDKASKKAEVFENMQKYAAQVFGLASAMMMLRRFFHKTVESIKELDEAFNQIAVVTNLTTNELWNSFDTYNTMAQQLGVRTVDAIRTSALYYQQGIVHFLPSLLYM